MTKPGATTFEQLRAFMREVSKVKLTELGRVADAEIVRIEIDRDVLAHFVAFILVTGDRLRITFRAHFNSGTAAQLLQQTVAGTSSQTEPAHSYELMKEYCNLCAGEIKRVLATNEYPCVVSLPLMIRGFDQIFEPISKERFVVDDRWVVRGAGLSFFCSARIEAQDSRDIAQAVRGMA